MELLISKLETGNLLIYSHNRYTINFLASKGVKCYNKREVPAKGRMEEGKIERMVIVKKQILSLVMAVLVVVGFSGLFAPKTVAAADTIGFVNANVLFSRHPDFQSAGAALQLEQQKAQQEFNSKANGLDDKGKRDLQVTLNERIAKREASLFTPIRNKVLAAVNRVAKEQGITVVLEQGSVLTGGKDLTQDVLKTFGGK